MYIQNWFYQTLNLLCQAALQGLYTCTIQGTDHIPPTGGFILVSNHLSHIDPPFLGSVLGRELSFFAKAELFESPWLSWLETQLKCIPIKRNSQQNLKAFRQGFQNLQQGYGLVIFPSGHRARDAQPQEAKGGVGMMACRAQLPVIPARIFGTDQALGVGQGWPQFDIPIGLNIGAPLLPKDYDPGPLHPDRYGEASSRINQAIYALPYPCPGGSR